MPNACWIIWQANKKTAIKGGFFYPLLYSQAANFIADIQQAVAITANGFGEFYCSGV